MEEDFLQIVLSSANTTYRALIVVRLVIFPDVDPECILRVFLCNFHQWLIANALQCLLHAISNGRPCKRAAEVKVGSSCSTPT